MDEWITSVILSDVRECDNKSAVEWERKNAFSVRVGVHLGSVLSPLLFIIVLEALSREFREGLPDDLVIRLTVG